MAKITQITPQKNKMDRVNIHLDGEYFCAMQNFICVKYGLKENQEVNPETLQKLVNESDREKAMNKVAKYLMAGIKTQKQVRDYLAKHGFDKSIADYVLQKLSEYNYVNDANYVKSYVNTYKHKYGKKKIEFELAQKGVAKDIISEFMSEFESEDEVLVKLSLKYLKNRELTYEMQQKLMAHLASKGFGWDDITRAINKIKRNEIS